MFCVNFLIMFVDLLCDFCFLFIVDFEMVFGLESFFESEYFL